MAAKEKNKVFVVTAQTCQQNNENRDDIVDLNFGVLRIFKNKEDVKQYMLSYYNDIGYGVKSIRLFENNDGCFDAEINLRQENNPGRISITGHELADRTYKEVIKCRPIEITEHLDKEHMDVQSDCYEEFYG